MDITAPGIRPPFQLHELRARPSTMNSPREPAVLVYVQDLDGRPLHSDLITPDQARAYARMLIAAADEAEGTPHA